MKSVVLALVWAAMAIPALAPAQAPLNGLALCRAIADNARRLECFDREVANLVSATDRKEVVVMQREEVRQSRRRLFGFTLPRIGLFGKSDDGKEDPQEIVVTMVAVSAVGYGKYRFATEDNGTWETTEAGGVLRASTQVTIRKGAMGGYFVTSRGGRSMRAMRIK